MRRDSIDQGFLVGLDGWMVRGLEQDLGSICCSGDTTVSHEPRQAGMSLFFLEPEDVV